MRRRRNIVLNLPICLLSALLAFGGNQLSEAVFHTEGGNFNFPDPSNAKAAAHQRPQQAQSEYYDVELANTGEELQRQPYAEYAQSRPDKNLAGIVDELNQMRRQQELYDELSSQIGQDVDGIPVEPEAQETVPKQRLGRVAEQQGSLDSELEELRRFGNKFRELTQARNEQSGVEVPQQEVIEEQPSEVSVEKPAKHHKEAEEDKPLSAQKKGQSEFVEFIEPVVTHSKKLKNKEYLEKRIASDDDRHSSRHSKYRAFNFISSSGNVIFIAFVTMCCVFSVVGVIGGMYYYNHIRTTREDPFDDFTRYSPAGPGRDKLKKGGRGATNAFGGFEKGDESLAYKAQLHHYQQTKQKIIGEQGAIGGAGCDPDASDKSDDEADLEHNFSVYECPGLAPTGDIEVQNPHFIESPTAQKKPSLK